MYLLFHSFIYKYLQNFPHFKITVQLSKLMTKLVEFPFIFIKLLLHVDNFTLVLYLYYFHCTVYKLFNFYIQVPPKSAEHGIPSPNGPAGFSWTSPVNESRKEKEWAAVWVFTDDMWSNKHLMQKPIKVKADLKCQKQQCKLQVNRKCHEKTWTFLTCCFRIFICSLCFRRSSAAMIAESS